MNKKELMNAFKTQFDLVGIINSSRYFSECKIQGINVKDHSFPTIVVVGLSYPKRLIKSDTDRAYGSFYTFGQDYHKVIYDKIDKVMSVFACDYEANVDNHPYDERLAAQIAGLGFRGKNQLIINKEYGSYIFLGMVFIDEVIKEESIHKIVDDCKDCRICIEACPTNALSETGYEITRCISAFNQTKKVLNEVEINVNYCLFGCDICQIVCPKNEGIKQVDHIEFNLSGKEGVEFIDLFTMSDKNFREKYSNMAYLWRGKTILMRNSLTILKKQKNGKYNDLIEESLINHKADWYIETAKKILADLKKNNPK